MVSPPPGVSSAVIVPPMASASPRRPARGRARGPAARRRPSRWNGSNIRSRCAAGTPGPRSTTSTHDLAGQHLRVDAHRQPGRGVAHRVGDEVGHDPLQEPGIGSHQRHGLVHVQLDPAGGRPATASGRISSRPWARRCGPQHPGLQPRQVEQVVDEVARAGARASSAASSAALPGAGDRTARAARRQRCAWCQRRAQVVGDRPQQRRCWSPRHARATPPRASRSRSRRYSSTRPAWVAKASSTRRSVAPQARPRSASTRSSSMAMWLRRLRAVAAATSRRRPRGAQPASRRRARRRPCRPKVSRSRSTIASAVSSPVSTDRRERRQRRGFRSAPRAASAHAATPGRRPRPPRRRPRRRRAGPRVRRARRW